MCGFRLHSFGMLSQLIECEYRREPLSRRHPTYWRNITFTPVIRQVGLVRKPLGLSTGTPESHLNTSRPSLLRQTSIE